MKNLTNIKERILFFIENQNIKISKFYTESGVSYGILTQKSKITEDNIVKFLTKYPQVNSEWLLTGVGNMLKSHQEGELVSEPNNDKKLIPFFDDVSTIGGHNSISAAVDGCMPASEWIDAGDWFNDATAAVRHYGDSMTEYPSGCILALKLVQDQSQIILGSNYCIETDEFRVTKRLQNGGDKEAFMAYSSNAETYPDGTQIHQPFAIKKTSIRRLYLVLGCVIKQFSSGAVYIQK